MTGRVNARHSRVGKIQIGAIPCFDGRETIGRGLRRPEQNFRTGLQATNIHRRIGVRRLALLEHSARQNSGRNQRCKESVEKLVPPEEDYQGHDRQQNNPSAKHLYRLARIKS